MSGGELARNAANHAPLSPVSFLRRSADVYPDKVAVIHGDQRFTYRELAERCARLASALARRGVQRGDTVAIMAPNIPAMLEAHFAVPGRQHVRRRHLAGQFRRQRDSPRAGSYHRPGAGNCAL